MKEQSSQPDVSKLIQQLVELLQHGHAHVTFNDAVKDIPFDLLGKKPGGLAYSIWQITEHIRIAQWDILDFSRNENYKEMKWPEDYWPKENAPESEAAWNECIKQINEDQGTFIDLLHAHAGDLFKANRTWQRPNFVAGSFAHRRSQQLSRWTNNSDKKTVRELELMSVHPTTGG
jgi:hypothetical protein